MSQLFILMGHLGGDPVMQFTAKGTPVTNFSVASSDYVGRDETGKAITKTTWFRCTAWNDAAENINKMFKKGDGIYIEGTILSDERGNPKVFKRQDGTSGAAFEINVRTWKFTPGNKKDSEVSGQEEPEVPVHDEEPPEPAETKKPIPF